MRTAAGLTACLGVTLLGARAEAADPIPADRTVVVVLAGATEDTEPMAQVLQELLGRLGVDLVLDRADRIDPAVALTPRHDGRHPIARAWVDFRPAERVTVYIADAPWERILARHVPRAPGGRELTREEIGHILETAVDGMLHGARIGVAIERGAVETPRAARPPPSLTPHPPVPAPAPPADEQATPSPAPGPSLRWGLGVGYEIAAVREGAPLAHGPVASVWLGSAVGRLRPGVWISVQPRVPLTVDGDIGVRLDTVALRGLASLDLSLAPRVMMRFGIGAGVDIVHVEPRPGSASAVVTDPRLVGLPVLRAAIVSEVRLASQVALVLGPTVDADPTGTRYVAEERGKLVEVLSPWVLRPGAIFGLTVP